MANDQRSVYPPSTKQSRLPAENQELNCDNLTANVKLKLHEPGDSSVECSNDDLFHININFGLSISSCAIYLAQSFDPTNEDCFLRYILPLEVVKVKYNQERDITKGSVQLVLEVESTVRYEVSFGDANEATKRQYSLSYDWYCTLPRKDLPAGTKLLIIPADEGQDADDLFEIIKHIPQTKHNGTTDPNQMVEEFEHLTITDNAGGSKDIWYGLDRLAESTSNKSMIKISTDENTSKTSGNIYLDRRETILTYHEPEEKSQTEDKHGMVMQENDGMETPQDVITLCDSGYEASNPTSAPSWTSTGDISPVLRLPPAIDSSSNTGGHHDNIHSTNPDESLTNQSTEQQLQDFTQSSADFWSQNRGKRDWGRPEFDPTFVSVRKSEVGSNAAQVNSENTERTGESAISHEWKQAFPRADTRRLRGRHGARRATREGGNTGVGVNGMGRDAGRGGRQTDSGADRRSPRGGRTQYYGDGRARGYGRGGNRGYRGERSYGEMHQDHSAIDDTGHVTGSSREVTAHHADYPTSSRNHWGSFGGRGYYERRRASSAQAMGSHRHRDEA